MQHILGEFCPGSWLDSFPCHPTEYIPDLENGTQNDLCLLIYVINRLFLFLLIMLIFSTINNISVSFKFE